MNVFTFIKNIFFPPGCVLCDSTLEPNNENSFCGKCADRIEFCNDGWCCGKCGKPIVSFGEKQLCYFCTCGKSRYFDRIISVFEYEGLVRSSILRYKSSGIRKYAAVYAQVMAARFFEEYSNIDFDFMCGAPSHKNHKREKGFDHVEEICRHFSSLTGIRHCRHALLKIRSTAKQRSLNYEMRMKNLVDSMIVNERVDVAGKTVLVIDDVCTTRATAIECAKTLKRSGAKKVFVLTLATTTKVS